MAGKPAHKTALAPLPPETFGRKLCRVREDVGGFHCEELAAIISQWAPISGATLSRLEHTTETPTQPRQRLITALACIACGIDPAELGVGYDDFPPAWDLEAVMRTIAHSSPCITRMVA